MEIQDFLKENENIPHKSKYHRETYYEHCMLVLNNAIEMDANRPTLIAAALHDIAKPRTQGFNKIGDACFYGHENVTEEEVANFIPKEDKDFGQVVALIQCHMYPYQVNGPDLWGEKARVALAEAIEKYGALYENFEKNLNLLHECDERGTVRTKEQEVNMVEKINNAGKWLDEHNLLEPERGVLVNLSGRSYETWSPEQLEATKEFASKVVDVSYPNIPPTASAEELIKIVDRTMDDVMSYNPKTVLCGAEMVTTHTFVNKLQKHGIKVINAASERVSHEKLNDDGTVTKEFIFEFKQFRDYDTGKIELEKIPLERTNFINLSNHPSTKWPKDQLKTAKKYSENIIDIAYPNIPPTATQEQIKEIIKDTLEKVIDANPRVVMCMGENITCHNFVKELEKLNIQTVATVTKPVTEKVRNEDGTERTIKTFKFEGFRDYDCINKFIKQEYLKYLKNLSDGHKRAVEHEKQNIEKERSR